MRYESLQKSHVQFVPALSHCVDCPVVAWQTLPVPMPWKQTLLLQLEANASVGVARSAVAKVAKAIEANKVDLRMSTPSF
jgi:hypothetical protein